MCSAHTQTMGSGWMGDGTMMPAKIFTPDSIIEPQDSNIDIDTGVMLP